VRNSTFYTFTSLGWPAPGSDLEKENARLKRLVADLSLDKQVLKDIASGNL